MLTNIEHWSLNATAKIEHWSLNAALNFENRRGPQKIKEARRRATSLLFGHALQFGNLTLDLIHVAWNTLSM